MLAFTDHRADTDFQQQLGSLDGVRIVASNVSETGSHIELTFALADLHDWKLRNLILDLAVTLGEERDATILCFFRQDR